MSRPYLSAHTNMTTQPRLYPAGQDPQVRTDNKWNEVTEEVVHAGSTKLKRPEQLREMHSKDPACNTSFFATQVVRSVDSFGARFETYMQYPELSLDGLSGTVKDDSFCRALVHHIRRAKHFVYIEANQFVGASFAWHLSPAVRRSHAQHNRREQQRQMQELQEQQNSRSANGQGAGGGEEDCVGTLRAMVSCDWLVDSTLLTAI
jgi:hypothetical protein